MRETEPEMWINTTTGEIKKLDEWDCFKLWMDDQTIKIFTGD